MAATLPKQNIKISKKLANKKPTLGSIFKKIAGTWPYMAPEIINKADENNLTEYNEKTEVFALGKTLAVIFEMDKEDPKNTENFLVNRSLNVPNDLNNLILSMVNSNPKKRPTVVEARIKLDQIFSKAGQDPANVVNACVISIDDFLNFSKQEKNLFLEKFKLNPNQMHAVVLQGSDNTTNLDYYDVRYQLIQHGIISVAPFMVKGNDKKAILNIVKDHYNHSLGTLNTKVFCYAETPKEKAEVCPHSYRTMKSEFNNAIPTGVDNNYSTEYFPENENENNSDSEYHSYEDSSEDEEDSRYSSSYR